MKNILGGYMLFWKPEGPQLEYRGGTFFIADLNPQFEVQWRMSRWELAIIGCKCIAAAIRPLKDKL